MTRRMFATLAVLLLGVLLAPAAADQDKGEGKDFVSKAAQCNLAEVKLGQLAAERATNPQVKEFAQQMVQDHQRAGKALQDIAGQGVTLPKDIDPQCREHVERLSKLSGAEFDRAYMQLMVEGHKKAIELFEQQSKSGADTPAKTFAAKMLPELRKHQEKAQEIAGKLK